MIFKRLYILWLFFVGTFISESTSTHLNFDEVEAFILGIQLPLKENRKTTALCSMFTLLENSREVVPSLRRSSIKSDACHQEVLCDVIRSSDTATFCGYVDEKKIDFLSTNQDKMSVVHYLFLYSYDKQVRKMLLYLIGNTEYYKWISNYKGYVEQLYKVDKRNYQFAFNLMQVLHLIAISI